MRQVTGKLGSSVQQAQHRRMCLQPVWQANPSSKCTPVFRSRCKQLQACRCAMPLAAPRHRATTCSQDSGTAGECRMPYRLPLRAAQHVGSALQLAGLCAYPCLGCAHLSMPSGQEIALPSSRGQHLPSRELDVHEAWLAHLAQYLVTRATEGGMGEMPTRLITLGCGGRELMTSTSRSNCARSP